MNTRAKAKLKSPIPFFLHPVLVVWIVAAGCATPCSEESFSGPFDAEKVAGLAHASFKVAWDAKYSARQDLRFSSMRPTRLDRGVVYYLDRLQVQAPWIAIEIEKHPRTPRCSSKSAFDIVALDALMLKARYRSESFRSYTNKQIEKLLQMIDEISSYYQLHKRDESALPKR